MEVANHPCGRFIISDSGAAVPERRHCFGRPSLLANGHRDRHSGVEVAPVAKEHLSEYRLGLWEVRGVIVGRPEVPERLVVIWVRGKNPTTLIRAATRFADRFTYLLGQLGDEAISMGHAMRGSAFAYEETDAMIAQSQDDIADTLW